MKDMLKDKIAGALYGVAIGDALGAPLEFMSAEQIAQQYGRVTEMIGGGWLNVRPGETTDDTAMTLAVAEGIMENPDDPIPGVGARFIEWANSGPKDIGGTCRASIAQAAYMAGLNKVGTYPAIPEDLWFDAAKHTAKCNGGRSGGNGALMRTVYPSLFYSSRLMAVETAGAIAQMTHTDEKSNEACFLYADVLYLITEAVNDSEVNEALFGALAGTTYDLEEIEREGRAGKLNPTGYVVDSMKCALYSLWDSGNGFEGAIIYAANLGGDADTIAAICGGLAGAYYGFEAIPDRWVATLSKADRKRLDAAVDAAVRNRRQS